jgi:diguanylate cyclase (GGDEF)-like protein
VSAKLKSKKTRALPANIKMTMVDAGGVKNCLATMSLWIDGEKAESERVLAMESAEFDSATGMLGRIAFMKAASLAYNRDGFRDRPAVICIDLVRFGELNERIGHEKCDEILEQLAERIKAQLRRGDWAGRMGSDEFCLYASFAGNANDARSVAERLLDAVSQPFAVGDGALEQVSATLGVAMGPKDGATIQALVSSAERALKEARAQGKSWEFSSK